MKKHEFKEIARSKAKNPFTPEEEAFFDTIGEAVEQAFTQESVERTKQLKEITDKLGIVEDGKSIAEVIRNLATTIDTLEAKSKRTLSDSDKYLLRQKLEEKKDEITRGMQGGAPWRIEFKAKRVAALMTNANLVTGATAPLHENWMEDMDIAVIQYPQNFILDAINSKLVSKVPETLIVKEQQAIDGTIGAVSQGAAKTLTQQSFVKTSYNRKKYAGRIEFTEEVEIDFEQLFVQVVQMFEDQVLRAWNAGVLADIIAYASSYDNSALDGTVPVPDVYSAIMGGMAWGADNNYVYDTICMNPADVWLAKSSQDQNGNYKVNPFVTGFAGLNLFVSTGVTAGNILLGVKNTIKEQHSNFIVRKGTHGDQFIENEATIVGEVFSVLQTPTVSKPSWLYFDIDTVNGLLQKA